MSSYLKLFLGYQAKTKAEIKSLKTIVKNGSVLHCIVKGNRSIYYVGVLLGEMWNGERLRTDNPGSVPLPKFDLTNASIFIIHEDSIEDEEKF